MKRLDFSKVKKLLKSFVKNIFSTNKKEKALIQAKLEDIKEETAGRSKRRGLHGYKRYTHILKPLNKRFNSIYRSFNKQQLPGKKIIIGKIVYCIKVNRYYSN